MSLQYIKFSHGSLYYRQYGNGPKLLYCFHGYGRESGTFSILEKKLGHNYTIIAIDAPFHGYTQWDGDLVVDPKVFLEALIEIKNELKNTEAQFSLMGFSMGGRIALYLTQIAPTLIERLVLIAPDGLNFNFWRWAGSDTWVGNKLLGYSIHHPAWILFILNKAEKLKVIHKSLADFVHYYVDDEEHRLLLYRRWISMRKFNPNHKKLKRLIRKHKIKVRMLFGAFDRIIPYQGGERFRQGIEEHATLKVIEAGHHLLNYAQVDTIAKLLID